MGVTRPPDYVKLEYLSNQVKVKAKVVSCAYGGVGRHMCKIYFYDEVCDQEDCPQTPNANNARQTIHDKWLI